MSAPVAPIGSGIDAFVSGVHSDPDPSAGIGIAKSLRQYFPGAALRAVDYSVRSSGLHHPVFDDALVQPVWAELDLETYAAQIRQRLEARASCWISALDVEIEWLATNVPNHPRMLVPSSAAQAEIRKPRLAAARRLEMRVPEFVEAGAAPTELHELGRRSGWRLWAKGKYHEAFPADGFTSLRRQIDALSSHWPLEDLFVQAHVMGLERAVTFAAHDGKILGAIEIEKRAVTAQGKTWAAAVHPLDAEIQDRLANLVAELRWTGGGEVEFVRDASDEDWLIDFNPRFPAYIYGVTLCGHNLPAHLVASALGIAWRPGARAGTQFIRVVEELPVRCDLPIPRMLSSADGIALAGKHPSFQPSLVRRLSGPPRPLSSAPLHREPAVPRHLHDRSADSVSPRRYRDPGAIREAVDALHNAVRACSAEPVVLPALSIKTDPYAELAHAFLSMEWSAEVISLRELEWALELGFKPQNIVFNGPAVAELVSSSRRRVGVAFADSAECLEALVESEAADVVGLRVRAGGVGSRFGCDLSDFTVWNRIIRCVAKYGTERPLGLHMHIASDTCGFKAWMDFLLHTLTWAEAMSEASGAAFSLFDIGGGWHPADFGRELLPLLTQVQSWAVESMPALRTLVLEPGKAVANGTAWLVTRILEARTNASGEVKEVVVDASIADLPMAGVYAHDVLHLRNGRSLGWVGGGSQRILGSICMEADVIAAGVGFAAPPVAGDELLISSAGGYNASMAWHFAGGTSRDTPR